MIRVENLHKRFGQVKAVDGVSFTAADGAVTGLLGPNGAGKTTLMGLVCGLLRLQSGRITVAGQALAHALSQRPPLIALAPQSDAFYPMLSVAQNLECFAAALGQPRPLARAAVAEALARVQLERAAAQRALTLSGGQRRRLNLAIALLAPARLLLLDEPTAGVDPQSRALLHKSFREFAAAGCAVVFSSHLMSEVEALAEDVVVLDGGRIRQSGALAEFLADRLLRFEAPADGAAPLAALLAPFGRLESEGAAHVVHLLEGQSAHAALAALHGAGVAVGAAQFGRASLEHAFIGLTSEALRDE